MVMSLMLVLRDVLMKQEFDMRVCGHVHGLKTCEMTRGMNGCWIVFCEFVYTCESNFMLCYTSWYYFIFLYIGIFECNLEKITIVYNVVICLYLYSRVMWN